MNRQLFSRRQPLVSTPRDHWFKAVHVGLIAILWLNGPLQLAAQTGGSYVITKTVLAGGGGDSASVNFQLTGTIGQDLTGLSQGGAYSVSSGFWNTEQAAPLGGLEGDTASRPNGSGTLTAADVTAIRRFVAGLDSAAPGGEYQRADCAPLASFGNALITATDITQTRRYVAALDAPNMSNGPASPGNRPQRFHTPEMPAARSISVVSQTVIPGQQAVVPLVLEAQGDETAASFSVTYDPAILSINNTAGRIALGNGVPGGTTLTRNISQAANGRLGIVLDADPGTPFSAGQRQLVTITFDVIGSLNTTTVGFGDVPVVRDVSDGAANSLPVSYISGTVSITAPTLARLNSFKGFHYPQGNLLRWQTGLEVANLGFRVFRQQNANCGPRSRDNEPPANCMVELTPQLIAGSALQFGGNTRLTAGYSYSWWDESGTPESVYWVEDLALDGERTAHGPITVADCLAGPTTCEMIAELLRPQTSRLLNELGPDSGSVSHRGWPENFAPTQRQSANPALVAGSAAWYTQLRLAAGAAVKIHISQTGWQRVALARLRATGVFPAEVDTSRLQLYADGVEIPLHLSFQGDGSNPDDTLEFYGIAGETRETAARVYWLVYGETPGRRIGPPVRVVPRGAESGGEGKRGDCADCLPPSAPASFPYTIELKERSIFVPVINNGEETENFFGTVITGAPATLTIGVRQLDPATAQPASLQVAMQGATAGEHRVSLQLNGQELGVTSFSGTQHKTARFSLPASSLQEGDNQLILQALGGAGDVSLVDTFRVTYPRRYQAENDQLQFTANSPSGFTVSGFSRAQLRVFDVTDPAKVIALAARVEPVASGYAVTVPGAVRGSFVAVANATASGPLPPLTTNQPSAWSNPRNAAGFLIIAPRAFIPALETMAVLRRTQGLPTAIIDIEDIYDEWSGGAKSTRAFRAFLRWSQDNWLSPPQYLLLAGDASIDPRNYLGYGDTDLVPTGYVATGQLETASDESLVDFTGDSVGEMSVGRFPGRTLGQIETMVSKTLNYQPQLENGAVLVADRPDGYNFAAANQALRPILPPEMSVATLNRAESSDSLTRQAILRAFNAGPALINYAGHGSVEVWTGAGLLQSSDAPQLTNGQRLPLVVAMTCLNGYFHDLTSSSLAEELLKAENGGAIAVWASSGLTVPGAQAPLNQMFVRNIYGAAQTLTLGEAARAAKVATSDGEVRQTWILFGDPTLRVR